MLGFIYGLIDPRNGHLRYVGKTTQGMARPLVHARTAAREKTHKANWIRQLQAEGLTYEVEVLEQHESVAALNEAERHLIAYFRGIGCDLTNLAPGGEGGGTRRGPHSAETRRRISLALRRENLSNSSRQSYAAAQARRFADEGQRIAISRSKGGRCVVDGAGRMYNSVADAARHLGVNAGSVSRACTHGWSVGSHTFKFAETT